MAVSFIKKHRSAWLYGCALAALLFLLKWLELRFVIYDHALDIYIGLIALLFTGLGIWLSIKLSAPTIKTIVIENTIYVPSEKAFSLNEDALKKSGLSSREMDVLKLMAGGNSNRAIAEQLYVSLNTVKTHCSNIFEKLEVSSRMQAIQKAKTMGLLP